MEGRFKTRFLYIYFGRLFIICQLETPNKVKKRLDAQIHRNVGVTKYPTSSLSRPAQNCCNTLIINNHSIVVVEIDRCEQLRRSAVLQGRREEGKPGGSGIPEKAESPRRGLSLRCGPLHYRRSESRSARPCGRVAVTLFGEKEPVDLLPELLVGQLTLLMPTLQVLDNV